MNCRTFQREISSFVDAELAPAAADALREHLAQCPECRSRYERVAALNSALRAMPMVQPQPDLAGEVKARIARAAARRDERSAVPNWIGASLAAMIILLAIGLGNLAGRSIFSIVSTQGTDSYLEMVASDTDRSLADVVLDVSSEENGQ